MACALHQANVLEVRHQFSFDLVRAQHHQNQNLQMGLPTLGPVPTYTLCTIRGTFPTDPISNLYLDDSVSRPMLPRVWRDLQYSPSTSCTLVTLAADLPICLSPRRAPL